MATTFNTKHVCRTLSLLDSKLHCLLSITIHCNLNEFLKAIQHIYTTSNYHATQKTSKQFIKN